MGKITAYYVAETEKALLVSTQPKAGDKKWIPKSVIVYKRTHGSIREGVKLHIQVAPYFMRKLVDFDEGFS